MIFGKTGVQDKDGRVPFKEECLLRDFRVNFHLIFLQDSKSNDCAFGSEYLTHHICIYTYKNSLMHSGSSPYNCEDKLYHHAKEELLKEYVDECKFRDNECSLNGHT